jgi:hypothetical protein
MQHPMRDDTASVYPANQLFANSRDQKILAGPYVNRFFLAYASEIV